MNERHSPDRDTDSEEQRTQKAPPDTDTAAPFSGNEDGGDDRRQVGSAGGGPYGAEPAHPDPHRESSER